jgi:hypothetical protein
VGLPNSHHNAIAWIGSAALPLPAARDGELGQQRQSNIQGAFPRYHFIQGPTRAHRSDFIGIGTDALLEKFGRRKHCA